MNPSPLRTLASTTSTRPGRRRIGAQLRFLLAVAISGATIGGQAVAEPADFTGDSSAEALIEQVLKQRALKALLTEQLEVSRLRAELQRVQDKLPDKPTADGIAQASTPQRDRAARPRVVALWEGADGRVATIQSGDGDSARMQLVREGQTLIVDGTRFAVRQIGPDGVRLHTPETDRDLLLPF